MLNSFLLSLQHYIVEVVPALAIGFLLSGIAHEFIPQSWIDRNLGGKGIRGILISTIVGTALPICCFGSLPVAVGFYKKGARLGPVLAFLVATPATSISALLVTYRLLGPEFTIFIFFAVILMGLVVGLIGNKLSYISKSEKNAETCPHCKEDKDTCPHCRSASSRLKNVLRFAFIQMPKDIGLETIAGILLAAFVVASIPIGNFIHLYLAGTAGYLFSLIFGLVMYICSTATVPLADAFVQQGMSLGAAMVLMLAGPVTSLGTLLVLRKEFGLKILSIYLFLISAMSLLLGILYGNIFG